jgi:uncharacterized protein YraI
MRNILRCLMLMVGFVSGAAGATTTTSNVNCRSQPRPSASIVARVSAGTEVSVERRSNTWSLIRHDPRSCWVATRYLADESTADANRASLRQTRAASRDARATNQRVSRPSRRSSLWSSTSHRSTRRSRPGRAPSYSYGSSCPCSGSNICVGPRGGRYCITSGGNKRYGM